MKNTTKDDGDLASFEGKYPKDLFNKSVVAGDNQMLIGYVIKETDELIVVFSESDSKSRFDIPKSQIAISGATVVVNNTGDILQYKVNRNVPLPQYNKGLRSQARDRVQDKDNETSTEQPPSTIQEQVKLKDLVLRVPVSVLTKIEKKTEMTTTVASSRSNDHGRKEEETQHGALLTTGTEVPNEPVITTEQDQNLANKKRVQGVQAETQIKKEHLKPEIVAQRSESITNLPANQISTISDKPSVTVEESKISFSPSSSLTSTPPPKTGTNVSVQTPADNIVAEEAVETSIDDAVTKVQTEPEGSLTSDNVEIEQQSADQIMEEQTISHTPMQENIGTEVEVTIKPPHNIEFNPPIPAEEIPKAIEETQMSDIIVNDNITVSRKEQEEEDIASKRKIGQNNGYLSNEPSPLATSMSLWQNNIINWIDISNDFATSAVKTAQYWFDLFWKPLTLETKDNSN
jgi:hypothetical protein